MGSADCGCGWHSSRHLVFSGATSPRVNGVRLPSEGSPIVTSIIHHNIWNGSRFKSLHLTLLCLSKKVLQMSIQIQVKMLRALVQFKCMFMIVSPSRCLLSLNNVNMLSMYIDVKIVEVQPSVSLPPPM